jgi:GT2 family glycosyltransferase
VYSAAVPPAPPDKPVRASIVIPSYRGRKVLPGCLDALAAQDMDAFEVIVVDDASGDGTAEWIEASFPWVRVLALPTNHDFCGAVNAGIRAARAPVVALLNDDTIPAPDWLSPLVERLEADDTLGFVASRMLSAKDPRIIDGAGDGYSRHGLAFRVGRGEEDDGRYGPRPVLWASGGASAYRRSVLEDVGLLDESFQIYYEDVDIGLAAHSRGWRGQYVPASSVLHIGGVNDLSSERGARLTTRNAIVVFAKHWPWRLLLRHAHSILYGQLRNAMWAARNRLARAWLSGFVAGVRAFPGARAKSRPKRASWAGELDSGYPFGAFRRRIQPTRSGPAGAAGAPSSEPR